MKNNVLLDFTQKKYSDAAVCEDNELFHQYPMQRVMNIWKRIYSVAKESKDDENEMQHRHDAISIFASRGAGKTTFLLSVLDRIQKDKKANVLCLDIIDPSLMESKQHAFVNIIAGIQEKVEEFIREKNYYSPKSSGYGKKLDFDRCYKKLLNALPFVDGVGKNRAYDEWEDSEYIAIQGMDKAIASNNLQMTFHQYVKAVLSLMDKECIVIPFDDIDTDFKRGFEILEVIRKYLTTSKVIVFLTGDLELYSKLVRNAFWKDFEEDYLEKERNYSKRSPEEFVSMINQLENQYLVKVLKPENRVNLSTLCEYLEKDITVRVKYYIDEETQKTDECDLLKYYRTKLVDKVAISALGSTHPMGGMEHFLSGLSVRLQMRIFVLLNSLKHTDKDYTYKLSLGLLDIFSNDIYQKAVNAKALMKGGSGYTEEMLKFLVNTRSLFERKNFFPESSDDVLNKALFAIGSEFSHLLKKHKYLVFDYWLRISYVHALLERVGDTDYELVNEFLSYTQMDTDTGLSKCVGLSHAYCNYKLNISMSKEDERKTMPGVIFVGNEYPLLRSGVLHVLSLLPRLGTIDNSQNENVFLSVYRLLAVVREFLFAADNLETSEAFILLVNRYAQYRNYLEPRKNQPFKNLSKESKEKDDLEFEPQPNEWRIWSRFIINFRNWKDSSLDNVSLLLLDKVFTRFYFTMIHMEQSGRKDNPGNQLSLCLISLLNAALVEDAMANGIGGMDLNNIGDIERIFIENVQKAKTISAKLCFYDWLKNCPIFSMFVNPLVYKLMNELDSEKIEYLDACLLYSQQLRKKDEVEKLLSDIYNEEKENKEGLNWIELYEDLLESLEEQKFLRKFRRQSLERRSNDVIMSFYEKEKKVDREVRKLENKLKPVILSVYGFNLSISLDEKAVHEYKKVLQQRADMILIDRANLEQRREKLDYNLSKISSFVKRYYQEEVAKEEKMSVYAIMCDL